MIARHKGQQPFNQPKTKNPKASTQTTIKQSSLQLFQKATHLGITVSPSINLEIVTSVRNELEDLSHFGFFRKVPNLQFITRGRSKILLSGDRRGNLTERGSICRGLYKFVELQSCLNYNGSVSINSYGKIQTKWKTYRKVLL